MLGSPCRRGLAGVEPRWANVYIEAAKEARSDLLTALRVGEGGLEVRWDGSAEGADGVDACRQPWKNAGLCCGLSEGCLGVAGVVKEGSRECLCESGAP